AQRTQHGPSLRPPTPTLPLRPRAHADAEVTHRRKRGAAGGVLPERDLALSRAELVMPTPPYRALNVPAS
ncbi:hypothetical protein EIJ50_20140, partial [Xanthomonas perforans]